MQRNSKGFAFLVPLIIIAVVGGGSLYAFKPKWLHGDSKRAAASVQATAAVTVAVNANEAKVAASVEKIGEANAMAPDSPAKAFISREVPEALLSLPAPDPLALLAAEQRRVAVMAGQLDVANKLYQTDALTIQKQNAALKAANAARAAVDEQLTVVAAERLATEHQRNLFIVICVLAALGWLYARIYGVSFGSLGKIVSDIRAGDDPIVAFDTNLAPWMHSQVKAAAISASTQEATAAAATTAAAVHTAPTTSP